MKNRFFESFLTNLTVIVSLGLLFFAFKSTVDKPLFGEMPAKKPVERRLRLRQVFNILQSYYVDKDRLESRIMCIEGLAQLDIDVDGVSLVAEVDEDDVTIKLNSRVIDAFKCQQKMRDTQLVDALVGLEQKVSQQLKLNPEKRETLFQELTQSLLTALDPHTNILSKRDYMDLKDQTQGKFGGLGIVVTLEDDVLKVVNAIKNTPADRAKITSNDRIVLINNAPTFGKSISTLVDEMRGEQGTTVHLGIAREAADSVHYVDLTRAIIKLQNVTSRYLGKGIGLVAISSFGGPVADDFRKEIKKLRAQAQQQTKSTELQGIVLDLRNNPGGLLEESAKVADIFVSSGILVSTKSTESSESYAKVANTLSKIPLAVLVNAGSASASEIVAGALQDHERAIIIGTRTFGKGSVQTLFELDSGSALKVTISKYYTPSGRSIQNYGITPDLELSPIYTNLKQHFVNFSGLQTGRREVDLKSHLGNGFHVNDAVYKRIRYLVDANALIETATQNKSDKKADYAENLASGILQSLGGDKKAFNAIDSLQKLDPVIAKLTLDEKQRINRLFSNAGIDWTKGHSTVSKVDVKLEYNKGKSQIEAGAVVPMILTVHNPNRHPIYNVRATVTSDSQLFAGTEFVIGRVAPSAKVHWRSDVRVPVSMPSMDVQFKIKTFAEDRLVHTSKSYSLDIKAIAQAQLQLSYEITDINKYNTELSGDRIVQTGESIILNVRVKNTGRGTTGPLQVQLTNLTGKHLQFEKNSLPVASLPSQGEARVQFIVHQKIRSVKRLVIGLRVEDKKYGYRKVKGIVLPVVEDSKVMQMARKND